MGLDFRMILMCCWQEIADIVSQTLKARDLLKTQAAQGLLKMRAASARVKVKLTTDPRLFVPVLDVEATNEEVVLRGICPQFRRVEVDRTVRATIGRRRTSRNRTALSNVRVVAL